MGAFHYVRGFSAAAGGHKGIDLGAARGTPLGALAAGTVAYAGPDAGGPSYTRGGGNVVTVHAGGRVWLYAHLNSIAVHAGQNVVAGSLLGAVGSTGAGLPGQPITGPHLHLAHWDPARSTFTDPARVMPVAAMIAALDQYAAHPTPAPTAEGPPLTFWGVVTFPTGHVLTSADVGTIMSALRAAGYFRDDASGLAAQGVRSLLVAMIGRTWDDQLARDIQRGLGMGADAVAKELPAVLPFGADIAGAIAGLPGAIAGVLGDAAAVLVLIAFVVVGLYLFVTSD